jgi:hypothetical protein
MGRLHPTKPGSRRPHPTKPGSRRPHPTKPGSRRPHPTKPRRAPRRNDRIPVDLNPPFRAGSSVVSVAYFAKTRSNIFSLPKVSKRVSWPSVS